MEATRNAKLTIELAGKGTKEEELTLFDLVMPVGRQFLEVMLPFGIKLVKALCIGEHAPPGCDEKLSEIQFLVALDQPKIGGEYKVWVDWIPPLGFSICPVFCRKAYFPFLGEIPLVTEKTTGSVVEEATFQRIEIEEQERWGSRGQQTTAVVVRCLEFAVSRALMAWKGKITHVAEEEVEKIIEALWNKGGQDTH